MPVIIRIPDSLSELFDGVEAEGNGNSMKELNPQFKEGNMKHENTLS